MKKCINCGREESENNAVTCAECGGELAPVEEPIAENFVTEEIVSENPVQEAADSVLEEQISGQAAEVPQEVPAEEETPKKKKTKLIVLITILAAILIAGATVGTIYYLKSNNDDVKSEEKKEEKKETKEEKKDEKDSGMSEEEMQKMLDADENLVAVIDGVGVTKDDYCLIYQLGYNNISVYAAMYGEDWYDTEIDGEGKTYGEYLKENTFETLKAYIAYEKLAEEYGVEVDEKTVEDGVKEYLSYFGEDFLEKANTSEDALKNLVKREKLVTLLLEKLTAEGGDAYVSDESILPEFEKNYVRVQHILISSTASEEGEENSDAALAKAKEVIKKLDEGADFDSLIEEYNEDPGMTKGSYYTFTDGMMVKEFEEASRNLQIGEYTKEPVKTDYGYHIIKKYELTTDCDEFNKIKQDKSQQAISDIIEKKISSVKFVSKDEAIDEIIKEMVEEINAEALAMQEELEEEVIEEEIASEDATDASAESAEVTAEEGSSETAETESDAETTQEAASTEEPAQQTETVTAE